MGIDIFILFNISTEEVIRVTWCAYVLVVAVYSQNQSPLKTDLYQAGTWESNTLTPWLVKIKISTRWFDWRQSDLSFQVHAIFSSDPYKLSKCAQAYQTDSSYPLVDWTATSKITQTHIVHSSPITNNAWMVLRPSHNQNHKKIVLYSSRSKSR